MSMQLIDGMNEQYAGIDGMEDLSYMGAVDDFYTQQADDMGDNLDDLDSVSLEGAFDMERRMR